ncbi:VRR-NUC domain-containing protein [Treponema lecithinolyticum]
MKTGINESEVVREVKEVIRITGLKLQRINTGCFTVGEGRAKRFIKTAEAGTLDFEGYDNHGRHVGIECKRPVGGRLSDEQAARIDDINRKGGVAFVVTSGNEALELLRKNKCI